MKSSRLALIVLVLLLTSTTCLAADGPAKRLQTIITQLQTSKDTSLIANYVHWDTAFKELPAQQKAMLKVSNAEQLKSFFVRVNKNPKELMMEQLKESLAQMPEEQRTQIQSQLEQVADQAQAVFEEKKQEFLAAEYTVGEAKIEGEKASVVLNAKSGEETRSENIDFILVDGTWYLPSLAKFSPVPEKGGRAPQSAPPTQVPSAATN